MTIPPCSGWTALSRTVCDVQGALQAGRDIAAERGTGAKLSFTKNFEKASGCHILYIAGTLQFLSRPCRKSLMRLPPSLNAQALFQRPQAEKAIGQTMQVKYTGRDTMSSVRRNSVSARLNSAEFGGIGSTVPA